MTSNLFGINLKNGTKLLLFYLVATFLLFVIIAQIVDLMNVSVTHLHVQENSAHKRRWSDSIPYHVKTALSRNLSQGPNGDMSYSRDFTSEDFVAASSDCEGVGVIGSRILILAAMRTGSSFLGEIFAQRKDFYYLFEPGQVLAHYMEDNNLSRNLLVSHYLKILEDMYRCDYSKLEFFTKRVSNLTIKGKKRFAPAVLDTDSCFTLQSGKKKGKLVCDEEIPPSYFSKICKEKHHIAIKAIRIPDINLLLHFMKDPKVKLKVIHLVRDPRGMVVSRLKMVEKLEDGEVYDLRHLTETIRYMLQRYCLSWAQNIEIGNYVSFVRRNYLLIRYEDMARQPVLFTRKVYSFSGLGRTIPENVQSWIQNNTASNFETDDVKADHPYSTARDSKSTYDAWRKLVNFEFVDAIQKIEDCRRMMKLAGYVIVTSETHLRDHYSTMVNRLPIYDYRIDLPL